MGTAQIFLGDKDTKYKKKYDMTEWSTEKDS